MRQVILKRAGKCRKVLPAISMASLTLVLSSMVPAQAAVTPTLKYSGFSVVGGPVYDGKTLSNAPAEWRAAVLRSSQTGQTQFYNAATGSYVSASLQEANTADAIASPNSVASGYSLPGGTRKSAYVWQQTAATQVGVLDTSGNVKAKVNITIKETLSGNTSDFWSYAYTLNYVSGGLYSLNVAYDCAVNETGKADDYCTTITYPNGAKEDSPTGPHTTDVHDLATGNTVNNQSTGFFATHSTPPPSGSSQVVKYAQLNEAAYFQQYNVTDHAYIRTFDACVPNKSTFSGVALCSSSGNGS